MTRLVASSTSEKKGQGQGSPAIVEEGYVYETVASLRSPAGIVVTPLGVTPRGGRLQARIYPSTRLSAAADNAYEACLSLPYSPHVYAYALLSPSRLSLEEPEAISTPCASPAPARIEAVIEKRLRGSSYTVLYLSPIHVSIDGAAVRGYTRALGCMIEALIAYTRVRHWSRRLTRNCGLAERWHRALLYAAGCVEHSAPGSRQLLDIMARLKASALDMMAEGGCPPPRGDGYPQ